MSHYCCKSCGQRYEFCRCSSANAPAENLRPLVAVAELFNGEKQLPRRISAENPKPPEWGQPMKPLPEAFKPQLTPNEQVIQAWMNPHIISFKSGAKLVSQDPEIQAALEGTVAWTPSLIGDAPCVVDKHGNRYCPRPLVYGDE